MGQRRVGAIKHLKEGGVVRLLRARAPATGAFRDYGVKSLGWIKRHSHGFLFTRFADNKMIMIDSSILPRPMYIHEFEPLVGQLFEVNCDPKIALLTLISVTPAKYSIDPLRTAFTLIFHSSPEILLVMGIYAMRAPGLEPAMIYIEQTTPPATAAARGYYYQAVFN